MRRSFPRHVASPLLHAAILAMLVGGCSGSSVPPLPSEVNRITVLPPRDHGGSGLVTPEPVSIVFWRRAPQRYGTFGDYLAREMERELSRRGYVVTHPSTVEQATSGRAPDDATAAAYIARSSNLPGPVLFADIVECDAEPDAGNIVFSVGVNLSLVDPATSAVLWEAHVPPQEVTLRDEGGRGRASREAAMWLARQALSGVKPLSSGGAPR